MIWLKIGSRNINFIEKIAVRAVPRRLKEFNRRSNYIEGLHVNSTYTAFAHFWLIKQMVKVKQWRFVTDEDSSNITALYRAFSDKIRLAEVHHFLSKLDRSLSLKDAIYNIDKQEMNFVHGVTVKGLIKIL